MNIMILDDLMVDGIKKKRSFKKTLELIQSYCVGNELDIYTEDINNWKSLYKDPRVIAMYR